MDDPHTEVTRSLRYCRRGQKTTWSPTYQRIFRALYPDGSWKEMQKETENSSAREFRASRSESWESQELLQGADIRSSKRVSINEDEARSKLTERSMEQQFSELSSPLNVEDVLIDSDVMVFVRRVLRKEFPDGNLKLVKSQELPIETVFKKTLEFNGKEKTVFVHLRNQVSTSTGHNIPKDVGSSSQATISSPPASVTSPYSERVGDFAAHTKASSWSGPHVPTPVPSIVSSNTFHRSYSTIPKCDGPYKAELQNVNVHDTESFDGPAEILERKLTRKELLDQSDFLALKQIHCGQVVEDEVELARLSRPLQREVGRVRLLRERLNDRYETYEEILEMARPSTTAVLAHRILLADAYLFHARIKQTNRRSQRRLYHAAVDIYSELLDLARRCLPADNASLLTLAERLSLILVESRSLQPDLIHKITSILDNAERSLNSNLESESRRKIRRARQNLGTLDSAKLKQVMASEVQKLALIMNFAR